MVSEKYGVVSNRLVSTVHPGLDLMRRLLRLRGFTFLILQVLRMRGYTLRKRAQRRLAITLPGAFEVGGSGSRN